MLTFPYICVLLITYHHDNVSKKKNPAYAEFLVWAPPIVLSVFMVMNISVRQTSVFSDKFTVFKDNAHGHCVGHCECRRGKRAGVLTRFRTRTQRPPLPAIFQSNVRSLKKQAW